MKRFNKNFFVLAASAIVALSLSSCHNNNDGEATKETVVDIVSSTPKTLKVALDSPLPAGAKLQYNGVNGTHVGGNVYVFENVADGGLLKIVNGGGTNLIEQTVRVNFDGRTLASVDLTVVTKNAGTPITAAGANANDNIDNVTSNVTLPASEVTANPSLAGDDLALTLFSEPEPVGALVQNKTYEPAPYSLDCEPDNTTFENPLSVVTQLPGAENCEFVVKHEDGTIATSTFAGTTLTAEIPHFSVWDIIMVVRVISISDDTEEIYSGSLRAGDNHIPYYVKAGFSTSETAPVIIRTFASLFGGKLVSTEVNIDYNVSAPGTFRIYQDVKNYVLRSGTREFSVKVYGAPHMVVETSEEADAPVVPTHNGGSND